MLASAALIAVSTTCVVHAVADFRVERLTSREMVVEPSHAAIYVLRIRNIGDQEGTAHVGDDAHSSHPLLDDFTGYALVQSDRLGCGELGTEYTGFVNDYRIVFDAGPIAPNSYLDCAMTIIRDATSRHDMAISWGVHTGSADGVPLYDHFADTALVGTLTDVSIETHAFGFYVDAQGFAHSTVELKVHNGGSVPLDPESVGACEDNYFRPFLTDGGGAAGCGDDDYGRDCFDWSYGFRTPQIDVDGTYRCLIRLTSIEPYREPLRFPIELDYSQHGGGFIFIDIDRDNDTALLRLEPDAGDGMPVPSNSRIGLIVCALIALAIGAWRMRARFNSERRVPRQSTAERLR